MKFTLPVMASLVFALAGCTEPPDSQGFAGLAQTQNPQSGQFLQPGPEDRLDFPDDFGPHPRHRIEWWYLTANLQTEDGVPLGLQWTQFRQALVPRAQAAEPPDPQEWPLEAAWMAHAAVSYNGEHNFAERLARGDTGQAGAQASPFKVWLDHWQLTPLDDNRWRLNVENPGWSFDLEITLQGPPVAHGQGGFSAKSASGEGSMYFSLVHLDIQGSVTLGERSHKVSGQGWFDREWSSQFLKAGQQGWDWFALHLDSGDKLMVFRLRDEMSRFRAGTWIPRNGDPVPLTSTQVQLQAQKAPVVSGYPAQWRLQIPDIGLNLSLDAPPGDYRNTGMFPYWESPVTVSGSHTGVGYMELTGYSPEAN